MNLQDRIEELYARDDREFGEEYFRAFDELKAALNEGRVRAAEPDPTSPTGWKVNTWVKKGILLGFRIGRIVGMGPVAAASPPPNASGDEDIAAHRPALQKSRNFRRRKLRYQVNSATSTRFR